MSRTSGDFDESNHKDASCTNGGDLNSSKYQAEKSSRLACSPIKTTFDIIKTTEAPDLEKDPACSRNSVPGHKASGSYSYSFNTVSSDIPPPDGDWGWVVTISSFFINVVIIGMHNCFGILYMDLVDTFKESLSKTAWVGSIAFGCILIFAPLGGVLANKFGCRSVSILGIVIASGSLFVSSYATSISMLFFTYGFGYGFGTSLCYVQGAVMVTRYFTTKRALASGMALAGSSLGAIAMAPFYHTLQSLFDWRKALRIIAGCTLLTSFCAASYKPLRKPGSLNTEERIKISPARKFVLDFSLWKNKAFLIWAIAVGLSKVGYLVPWVHMVKLSKDIGQSVKFGTELIQYMGVSATVSRLFIGKIVDHPQVNRLYVAQISSFLMGLTNIIHAYTRSHAGMLVYSISLGVLDGGVEILLPIMTLDLVGAENLSVAWGCILAIISISSMGPPVAGAIRETSHTYLWAFYFAGLPMILASIILFLIPWAKRQHQEPATSILSINPSHLEVVGENPPPEFDGSRIIGRLRRLANNARSKWNDDSRKKYSTKSTEILIKRSFQHKPRSSAPYNKQVRLPGT